MFLSADSLPPTTRERPPGCKTVFIGGLPENITEEMLQEMFKTCGTICSLRLSKKNFAHIRFTTMDAVDKALFFSGEIPFDYYRFLFFLCLKIFDCGLVVYKTDFFDEILCELPLPRYRVAICDAIWFPVICYDVTGH